MSNDLVSVIIPTYGGGNYLKRAIESVARQSYSNIEVIVVDDNGIDTENNKNTVEIVSLFKEDDRIRLISHEVNKNGAAARNTGAKAAKGKYIGFLDDDDIYHIDNIKNQVSVLSQLDETYGLTYCSNEVYLNEKKLSEAHVWKEGYVFADILTSNIEICTSSLLVKRDAYFDVGGFDESFKRHQDYEFLVRMTNKFKAKPVDYIGFRRYITRRNSAKKYEQLKEWRMHYLEKMRPYIESLPKKTQKDIYIYHNLDIAVQLIKERRFFDYIKVYLSIHPGYRGVKLNLNRAIYHLKKKYEKNSFR